jgi:hypothetical protein
MMKDSHNQVIAALTARSTWEDRQRIWYQMRRDGLNRKQRAPWQADLHYPLIASVIEKMKPFYYNQVMGALRVPQFVSIKPQAAQMTESAADYLDYVLKQETEFEPELLSAIDFMCERGIGVLRVRWSEREQRLQYDSIDPVYLIMPASANSFQDADWFVHVRHISKAEYRRTASYDQMLLPRLCGNAEADQATNVLDSFKEMREGITHTQDKEMVVLWDRYDRGQDGAWTCYTYSPTDPEALVRQPFKIPYTARGKPFAPFVRLTLDIADKGWYAPRGIAELLAPYESYICKCWNAKADYLAFAGKPLFTSDLPVTNQTNLRMNPGDFLPAGVKAVTFPEPPVTMQEEIFQTRLTAEQSIMVPDFGIGSGNSGGGGATDRKTATEVDYIRSLSSFGVDLKGKIFRRAVAELLKYSWAILVSKRQEEITWVTSEDTNTLPAQALQDQYLIEPAGSAEMWNKQQKVQRAMARFQLLLNHPNVRQPELVKDLIMADDPRMVKTLWQPDGFQQAQEAEDEAMEIVILMSGFPAAAKPNENHQLRIQILAAKLEELSMRGVPVDPLARQRIQEHMVQHMLLLQQVDPKMAGQIQQAMMQADGAAMAAPGEQPTAMEGQPSNEVPAI